MCDILQDQIISLRNQYVKTVASACVTLLPQYAPPAGDRSACWFVAA